MMGSQLFPAVLQFLVLFLFLFCLHFQSSNSRTTPPPTTTATSSNFTSSSSSSSKLTFSVPYYLSLSKFPTQQNEYLAALLTQKYDQETTPEARAAVASPHLISDQSLLLTYTHVPLPRIRHLRVLYVINSFDLKQFRLMMTLFPLVAEMCQFGWHLDVIIQTTVQYVPTQLQGIHNASFCPRLGASVNVTVQQFPRTISFGLAKQHRELFRQNLRRYDLFIYTEDDMPLTLRHILLYLWELAVLPDVWIPGFIRWAWNRGARSLIDGTYDYAFMVRPNGDRWYYQPNLPYQAFTILTQPQLEFFSRKCHFFVFFFAPRLDAELFTREVMSSLHLFCFCGVKKVVPVDTPEYWDLFMIHHLSNGGVIPHVPIQDLYNNISQCLQKELQQQRQQHPQPQPFITASATTTNTSIATTRTTSTTVPPLQVKGCSGRKQLTLASSYGRRRGGRKGGGGGREGSGVGGYCDPVYDLRLVSLNIQHSSKTKSSKHKPNQRGGRRNVK